MAPRGGDCAKIESIGTVKVTDADSFAQSEKKDERKSLVEAKTIEAFI